MTQQQHTAHIAAYHDHILDSIMQALSLPNFYSTIDGWADWSAAAARGGGGF